MAIFRDLWDKHPANWTPPVILPCQDKKGNVHPDLANQCAIRLGMAFQGTGVSTASLKGSRCWNNHGNKHILKVLQMVPWIDKNTKVIGCKPKVIHKNVDSRPFNGKVGIFYFQNFYGRNNRGDHIDLWNGRIIAHGDLDYFERSEEVWFWEM
jgi:hypothetical protein